MGRLVKIISYGCQMNAYDFRLISRLLSEKGYEETKELSRADLVLVNTCSVRQHAEDRAWGRLGVLKGVKASNPKVKIGVCGCMAQRLGAEIMERLPDVDFVVGPDNYREILELVEAGAVL